MNRKTLQNFFYFISALTLACGIFLTAGAIRETLETLDVMQRRNEEYGKMQLLQRKHNQNMAIIKLLEDASSSTPLPLSNLIDSFSAASGPDIRDHGTRNISDEWALREVQLVFRNASLKDIASFIHAAENQPMPWMLTEYHATASDAETGSGNVIILLRSLVKR